MNVLIVDDSKTIRRVLSSTVQRYFKPPKFLSIKVFTAEDGSHCMKEMQANPIDIVFLDWHMPNMTGEEAVEAIRSDKKYEKTRIIMATTEGEKGKVLKMIKKGVNGYLAKPFNEESVFKALDKLLKK